MAQYSIEILDGERAGETLTLTGERFTIGRKPNNQLALKDDKMSGVHAELVVEGGVMILRDLGSTNGTRIENRKIDEVPLSSGDVFQVGATKFRFRTEGVQSVDASSPAGAGSTGDIGVIKIDAQALARARKRRSSLPLVVLVLLVAGGGAFAYWRFVLGGGGGGGGRVVHQSPISVPGNLLAGAAADAENDTGYELAAGGAGFSPTARAHSGSGALEAALTTEQPFALARGLEPLTVSPGDALRLSAWVAGDAGARATVRVGFWSSQEFQPEKPGDEPARAPAKAPPVTIAAGAAPVVLGHAWQAVNADVVVPPGLDRATVFLVAVADGPIAEQARARFDDVAVVRGDAKANESEVQGRRFFEGGGWIKVDAAGETVIRSIAPIAPAATTSGTGGDAITRGLAACGLLLFCDLGPTGTRASFAAADNGIQIRIGADGGGASGGGGLRIVIPGDKVGGCMVQSMHSEGAGGAASAPAQGRYTGVGAQFEVDGVRAILFGDKLAQMRLSFAPAGKVTGAAVAGGRAGGGTSDLALVLPTSGALTVQIDFQREQEEMNRRVRAARSARQENRLGDAFARWQSVLDEYPFDSAVVREASRETATLQEDLKRKLDAIDKKRAAAEFFDNRGAYDELLAGLAELGSAWQAVPSATEQIASRTQALETKAQAVRLKHSMRRAVVLREVADVLKADKRDHLSALISGYIQRRHGDAAKAIEAMGPGHDDDKKGDR